MVVVVPSLLKKVLNQFPSSPSPNFLKSLSLLDINHDTLIPSYFNDKLILVHLALILYPQIGGDDALKKIGLQYLEDDDETEENPVDPEATDVPEDNEESDVDVKILDAPHLSL
jgi:hypothetical protein